jgi:predicted P-loop ATPase
MYMELEKFLNKKYCFRYNEVREKVLVKRKNKNVKGVEYEEMNTRLHNSIVREASKKNIKTSPRLLKTLLSSDFVSAFCPFKKYFKKLPKWDGSVDYIGDLAKTISTTDDEFFQWAFKKWIVAMVACSVKKTAVNQTVLILSGKQGIGKTTWFKNILPAELKSYFAETSINPSNKDSTILLTEKILVNMDELTSFDKKNTEKFKELISKEIITERKPYGMYSEDYIRRASFSGTTNKIEFLTDVTGNRRYLCVKAESIDYQKSIDLTNVYSQAYTLFKKGFKFYFDKEDIKRVERNNEFFRNISFEEECLDSYFRAPIDNEKFEYMNATDIVLFFKNKIGNSFLPEKIGKLLSSKGFMKAGKQKKYKLVLIDRSIDR